LEESKLGSKEKERLKNKLAEGDLGAVKDPAAGLQRAVSLFTKEKPILLSLSSSKSYSTSFHSLERTFLRIFLRQISRA